MITTDVVFVPQAKQSLATLNKDVPKRHSVAMPSEPVVNGSQEWVMQADLPLTAAIRQSQQTLYHSHPADRQGTGLHDSMQRYFFFSPLTRPCPVSTAALRISPCHSRQPSVISDASAADGDRSSTPSDINSPRHRTHSLCNVRAAWHPRPSKQPSQLAFISTFTLLKYSVPALLISMASGARFVLMVVHAD